MHNKDNWILLGGVYTNASPKFQRGILVGLSRCLKADCHDAAIVLHCDGEYESRGEINNMEANYPFARKVDKDGNVTSEIVNLADIEKTGKYRIRKLTPKECWRLQGFKDEEFQRAVDAGVSNSQLYKQAGNSITVDVLYYIFKNLYEAMPYLFNDLKVGSYFSGIGAPESALDRLYADINTQKC